MWKRKNHVLQGKCQGLFGICKKISTLDLIFSSWTNEFSLDGNFFVVDLWSKGCLEWIVIQIVKCDGGTMMIWRCMCIHGYSLIYRVEGCLLEYDDQPILKE